MSKTLTSIALVSCVARKRDHATKAADLYQSQLFIKARKYAEANFSKWAILSAAHGLLSPSKTIEPYDATLNAMSATERRDWARRVLHELESFAPAPSRIVILAGQKYREHLVRPLRDAGHSVEIPMEGLFIGQQLRWLNEHT